MVTPALGSPGREREGSPLAPPNRDCCNLILMPLSDKLEIRAGVQERYADVLTPTSLGVTKRASNSPIWPNSTTTARL